MKDFYRAHSNGNAWVEKLFDAVSLGLKFGAKPDDRPQAQPQQSLGYAAATKPLPEVKEDDIPF